MGDGEGEDGEALGQVVLHPEGELGSGGRVGGHEIFESRGSGGEIGAKEDGTDVGGDFGAQIETGDISLSVLLEMELAALPGDGREDGGASRAETGVGVTNDEGEAVEAAGLERGEEGAPVGFGLAEGDADAEDGALAIEADADGDEDGAVQKLSALANLLVAGIEDQVGTGSEGAFPPGLEFAVESGGTGADLGRAHGVAAQLLDDFGDLAGGDALDIHLGEGEHQGLFAAEAFFQSTGVKVHPVADLGDAERDGADAGGQGLGFKTVGAAQAGLTALVGPGLEDGGTFLDHGLVDQQAQALGKARGTFGGQKLQNSGQKIRINLVGHVCVLVGCVWLHPNRNHTGPLPASLGASPIRGRLRSARSARLLSAAPGWGAQERRSITEELLHPQFSRLGILFLEGIIPIVKPQPHFHVQGVYQFLVLPRDWSRLRVAEAAAVQAAITRGESEPIAKPF